MSNNPSSQYYAGGYEPQLIISRVETIDYGGCVALQAWASIKASGETFGELYGFWGGVRDDW